MRKTILHQFGLIIEKVIYLRGKKLAECSPTRPAKESSHRRSPKQESERKAAAAF